MWKQVFPSVSCFWGPQQPGSVRPKVVAKAKKIIKGEAKAESGS
jgi:hypothetical protein